MTALVLGSGIFGVTAALALRRAGHRVTLVDPGPVPHPDAASTDISKLIRPDYGLDDFYVRLMSKALDGWHRWNAGWPRPLYHETGVTFLKASPMNERTFEANNLKTLSEQGLPVERLDAAAIRARFPPWANLVEGYVSLRAGWAESGAVVSALVAEAEVEGVEFSRGAPTVDEARARADLVVVAAGAWTPVLLPELADRIRPVGQPVLHFRPSDSESFKPPHFLPWAQDTAETGWYGFCANADGIVKVANHGAGVPTDPRGPRKVDLSVWEPRFRDFLARRLPALADAPIVHTRLCLYSDSFDGDFFVDRVPGRPGVVVTSGGSGHGFKFGPVLGDLLLQAVEGRPEPRFAWREAGSRRTEGARSAS